MDKACVVWCCLSKNRIVNDIMTRLLLSSDAHGLGTGLVYGPAVLELHRQSWPELLCNWGYIGHRTVGFG